jgi:hypothetical protein
MSARSLRLPFTMPVREFVDEDGREWRAWDIKPEEIHPVTKAEDYLADCFITGWIVFETRSGDEKRRLCPWPMNWAERSDQELRELLHLADRIPHSRVTADRITRVQPPPTTADQREDEAGTADLADLEVIRTFRYPGGRFWTVCVVAHPEGGGPPVLRFQSGLRYIDLETWPRDWADHPDQDLVWMLRRGAPRTRASLPASGTPQRRWDDSSASV